MPKKVYTEEVMIFIKMSFRTHGNVELAELCNEMFPKKTWTSSNIGATLAYYKLIRTKKENAAIKQKYKDQHRYKNCGKHSVDAEYPVGTISTRHQEDGPPWLMIKVGPGARGWRFLKHVVWERERGPIPKDHIIIVKPGHALDENMTADDLECMLLRDYCLRIRHDPKVNTELSDNFILNYPSNRAFLKELSKDIPEVIELVRQTTYLKRAINEQQRKKA